MGVVANVADAALQRPAWRMPAADRVVDDVDVGSGVDGVVVVVDVVHFPESPGRRRGRETGVDEEFAVLSPAQ